MMWFEMNECEIPNFRRIGAALLGLFLKRQEGWPFDFYDGTTKGRHFHFPIPTTKITVSHLHNLQRCCLTRSPSPLSPLPDPHDENHSKSLEQSPAFWSANTNARADSGTHTSNRISNISLCQEPAMPKRGSGLPGKQRGTRIAGGHPVIVESTM